MKTATSTKAGTRCLCLGAPRDRACARRERWGRWSFRAAARGGIGCRRSYARSGPVPLRLTYLVGRFAVLGSVPHMCHMRDRPRRSTQGSTLPSRHRVNLVRCGGGAECFRWRWLRGFG
jgi:hypothetical protein